MSISKEFSNSKSTYTIIKFIPNGNHTPRPSVSDAMNRFESADSTRSDGWFALCYYTPYIIQQEWSGSFGIVLYYYYYFSVTLCTTSVRIKAASGIGIL